MMLGAIVRASLRFRGIVIALAAVTIGYGVYSAINAKYDVFPEFATPQISVQTEAAGLSPEQVEILVTQPIENALNGAPGIESIRSESAQGLSLIVLNFDPKSDIYRDRQDVAERLATLAGSLPSGVKLPVMTPLTSSTGDLLTIGLVSDKLTSMQLRTVTDWLIVPRLLAVPGVAKASVYGGDVRQIQIQIDARKLIAHELSVDEVLAAAQRATGVRGAGFLDTRNQRIVIRSEGESLSASQIGAIVVAHRATGNVTLADLGAVVDAPAPPISEASVMGRRAVIVNVWAQYRANTLEATAGAERALDELAPALKGEGIAVHPRMFRAANYIELATHNINVALILGAILVVMVLFLFLADFRAAAISCTAIPLSLLVGVIMLQKLGLSLNTMTLGGLAIAIGEVVDDAVIDVENIQRRLRESVGGVLTPSAAAEQPPSATDGLRTRPTFLDVIFDASLEVRGAVVYATFAVALVFVPILTMSGLAGRLFAPMALAYLFSILASLAVALTVTPALCALLLFKLIPPRSGGIIGTTAKSEQGGRSDDPAPAARDKVWLAWTKVRYRALLLFKFIPPRSGGIIGTTAKSEQGGRSDDPAPAARDKVWLAWTKVRYRALLLRVEEHPVAAIGAVAVITIVGLALIPLLGRSFLPDLHENHYLIHVEMAPGTSIAESARVGVIVQRALMQLPFVREVGQRVGRASSDDVYGPQTSELELDLKDEGGSVDAIRETLDRIPGAVFAINTFLTERIEETISGYTAPVVVHVVGNDLDLLDAKAQEVARVLSGIAGAADVQVTAPPGTPELVVRLRPNDVARWGFDPVDVLETLRVAYSGHTVGQLFEGNRVFEVSAILPPEQRSSIDAVANLPLRSPAGTYLRLRDVADIFQGSGRSVVQHEAARRVQNITCNVEGRDVGSFVSEARRAVSERVRLPAGAYFEFTGAAEAEAQSRRDLLIHSSIAVLGVIALLSIIMRRARNVLLVALNLPFALVGGVVAALVAREALSVGSLVGFVTLFGITLRNSIMLLSHYEHLVTVEGAAWRIETAVRGAAERLVPIVMTSVVTALGLLPLALGRHAPGREIEGAMAVVILGGLITSTTLNLLVLPTLAFRYGRFGGNIE